MTKSASPSSATSTKCFIGFVSNVTQPHCRELTNSATMRSTSKRGDGYSGVPLRNVLEYFAGMAVMLTGIRPQHMHEAVHGYLRVGLCEHGFMKAGLRISIKNYQCKMAAA